MVFASGTSAGAGGTGYVSIYNGSSWGAPTQPGTGTGGHPATAVNAVYALDATHAWAVGTSGTGPAAVGTVWFYNGTTWDLGTTVPGTSTLGEVGASDASNVWAVGTSTAMGNPGAVTFDNGTSWSSPTTIPTAKTLTGIYVADLHGHLGLGYFERGGRQREHLVLQWVGELLKREHHRVDDDGAVSAFGPAGHACADRHSGLRRPAVGHLCRRSERHHPGLQPKLKLELFVSEQQHLPCRDPRRPRVQRERAQPAIRSLRPRRQLHPVQLVLNRLSGNAGADRPDHGRNESVLQCQQRAELDQSDGAGWDRRTASQQRCSAAGTGPTAVAGTPTGCTLDVLTPGSYSSGIHLNSNTTNFFESGVYYFTGGWGALDNGGGGTDNLYIIGGQPAPGDVNQIAQNSPAGAT